MNAPPKPLPLGLTLLILLALLLSSALVVKPVSAASIAVNSNADVIADDGMCTLREAIDNANNGNQRYSSLGECASGTAGADTITFAGNYTITLSGSRFPTIGTNITIIGNGAANTIIQASTCNPVTLPGGCTPATHKVFEVSSSGSLTLDGVTVRHGSDYSGGGILNKGGMLTVNNSVLYANFGEVGGGAILINQNSTTSISNSTISGNSGKEGGAIWNWGDLTITNSTLYGNAGIQGGGIRNHGSLKYIHTIIAGSTGGDCVGFTGIHPDSTHNLVEDGSCALATNFSGDPKLGPLQDNGGSTLTHALLPGSPAIDAGSEADCPDFDQRGVLRPQGAGCDIGAFEVETMVVTNTSNDLVGSLREAIGMIPPSGRITFSASLSGQIINLDSTLIIEKNLTIDGSDLAVPITISGNNAVGVFVIGPFGEATFDSLKIINGDREIGGGIYNLGQLTVVNSVLSGNMGDDGGGIFNQGELTVTNSTISGNAAFGGGGIFNFGELWIIDSTLSGNQAFFKGGGVFNNGTLVVDQSTFSANNAMLGGGIRNDDGVQSNITVNDSTFFENTAAHGGAIDNWGDGPNLINTSSFIENTATASGGAIRIWSSLTVENSTLSGNSSESIGGGFNIQDFGVLTLQHVTLNENKAVSGGGIYVGSGTTLKYIHTIIAHSTNGDCIDNGTIYGESTHNLVKDGSCFVASNLDGDPMLGPLANNGGLTLTHALLADSPAIDAAHGDYCLATDQRGAPRPRGAACDIGAFEYDIALLYLPLMMK